MRKRGRFLDVEDGLRFLNNGAGYYEMPVRAKIEMLRLLVNELVASEPIRQFMDRSAEEMREMRKEIRELSREEKRL